MSEAPKQVQVTGLSKWELALYVGAPVAAVCLAGLAYQYLNKNSVAVENAKDDQETDAVKSDKAEELVEDVKEKTPEEKAHSSKLKGNKYFKGGKFELAIECYTEAINLCPEEKAEDISTFYQNRAAAYEQLKNWNNVICDCSQAIDLNPKYTKALMRRARALENLGRKIECLEDVTAVCLVERFQNQEFLVMADRIIKEIGKELAEEYIKKRKCVLPSPVFIKSYLDSFSTDAFSVNFSDEDKEKNPYYTAIDQMKAGNFDNIINLCTEEINQGGSFQVYALLLRGTLHTLMSSVPEAIADFTQVINDSDETEHKQLISNALIKRASLRMQQANDTECFADFEAAISLDDSNADTYHHRGQIYFLTEQLDKAKQDFEKAISCNENFIPPRLQLGYCICKMAMLMYSPSLMQDANKLLEDVTVKFPDSAEAWSLFGQLLQDQQQFADAEEKLDKAIALQPSNPTTHVYKALLYLQWKKDFTAAGSMIREAIALDSKCDFAYETLATLEVQMGNTEEAVALFSKAIELVRTETEMAQTFSLLEAAKAQGKVVKRLGIALPITPNF